METKDKRSKNGGARAGSGRKRLGSKKRITLSTRVSPETMQIVRALRDSGESIPDTVDKLFYDKFGDCLKD